MGDLRSCGPHDSAPEWRPLSPAVEYRAFAELLRRVKTWTVRAAPRVGRYAKAAVAGRIVQRVADMGFLPFMESRASRHAGWPDGDTTVRCGGLVIRTSDGKTRPEFVAVIRSVGRFVLTWLEVLALCVSGFFGRGRARERPATLLFGMGMSAVAVGGDDRRFAEFCRLGPIEPLREAAWIIVETRERLVSTQPEQIQYTTDPLFELARAHPWPLGEFLRFLVEHARALIAYIAVVARCRLACILARDVASHALVVALNRRGLIEAVVMPHSVLGQPLWMNDLLGRRFTTHMVWFSTNSTPLRYASDGVRADHPSFRHIRIDVSWVWTGKFVEYLRGLGVAGAMNVVGPILWYLPERSRPPRSDHAIRIAVFDVTPVKPELERRLGIVYRNYYRTDHVVSFVEDVLAARQALEELTGKRVLVSLKPKRPYGPIHDPRYIGFIEQVKKSLPGVGVVPPETNVFSLIAASDVAVVIPYSSPAYVASHLGRPAVYYDPTEELLPSYEESPWITFVAGRGNLIKTLAAVVDKVGYEQGAESAVRRAQDPNA